MRPFFALLAVTLVLEVSCLGQPMSEGWVIPGNYGSFHVVIPQDATDVERAAGELFADYWERRTGEPCRVSTKNERLINVWIGRAALQINLVRAEELQPLGENGFVIRGFSPSERERQMGAGKQLAIAALTDAGTMNGVHTFFHDYLGVRWITPGLVFVPRTLFSLNDVNYVFRPCFPETYSGFNALLTGENAGEFVRAHGFDSGTAYGPFGDAGFYWILPPERFFASNPEYYAEVGGERVAWTAWRDTSAVMPSGGMTGQLCCGNPELAAAIVREIVALYRAGEDSSDAELANRRRAVLRGSRQDVVNLSPMPWGGACDCPMCAEIDAREGSRAASLLVLANRVVAQLNDALPSAGLRVHVVLPAYARRPPATLRPEEKVSVQLSMSTCDYLRPLSDAGSTSNAAFVKDLEGWSRICGKVYIWDFGANVGNPLRPHPNMHVVQDNCQLFDRFGVTGVFVQARPEGERSPGDFDAFRSYHVATALRDPDYPWDQARDEFFARYYGPAAPYMRDYWDLLLRRATSQDVYLHAGQNLHWMDYATVVQADRLFQEALAANVSKDVRARLERDYLGLQYAALVCPPKITVQDELLLLERPPSPALDELAAKLASLGDGSEPAIARLSAECAGTTPPRRQEVSLITLEDDAQLVWIAPALHGAVLRWQDKKSGRELLRGFTNYGGGSVLLHEVIGELGEEGAVFATVYEIVEQTPTRAVLRAKREDGLVLERTLALRAQKDGLDIAVVVRNEGSKPKMPSLVLRGELNASMGEPPEPWTCQEGVWERRTAASPPERPWQSSTASADATGAAYQFPGQNFSVILAFEEDQRKPVRLTNELQPSMSAASIDTPITTGAIPPGGTQELRAAMRLVSGEPAQENGERPAWAM